MADISVYKTISNYDFTDEDVTEVNDGTIVTDDSGYIDSNTYILQALQAGQDLDELRAGTYEYDDDGDSDSEPDFYLDPLRTGWSDPADADSAAYNLFNSVANRTKSDENPVPVVAGVTSEIANDKDVIINTSEVKDPKLAS